MLRYPADSNSDILRRSTSVSGRSIHCPVQLLTGIYTFREARVFTQLRVLFSVTIQLKCHHRRRGVRWLEIIDFKHGQSSARLRKFNVIMAIKSSRIENGSCLCLHIDIWLRTTAERTCLTLRPNSVYCLNTKKIKNKIRNTSIGACFYVCRTD